MNIYEDHKIILDDLFFVYYYLKPTSDDFKIRLKFISNTLQVAPEFMLISINHKLDLNTMKHKSVDVSSLGLYAMEIFNIAFPALFLKGDSESLFKEIIKGDFKTTIRNL